MRLPAVLLLLAPFIIGCSSSSNTTTGDEILLGTADTAGIMGEVGEAVFWEVPRFIVWTAPKALLYDFPRQGILAIQGSKAQVEELIGRLSANDLTLEEEILVTAELRSMTGLPISSSEEWRSWWEVAKDVPEDGWREAFVSAAIDDLDAKRYFVRSDAIENLRTLYGVDLGYDPKDPPAALAAGAERWRLYFEEHHVPPLRDEPLENRPED